MSLYKNVIELIGNTPVVDISELSPNKGVKLYVKLEGLNPGGSVKDRAALFMVDAAERDEILKPGATLLEPSSGNTGIGLALICRVRGYNLKVVIPENVSRERRDLLKSFGAEIIFSPGDEGSNGAVKLALKIVREHPEYVFLYQYANPANPEAHYRTTGPEIVRDVPNITHFVAGLGTSGTLLGVGRYLKEYNPEIKIWAVEPPAGELVQGLRSLEDGYIPPIFLNLGGEKILDRKMIVSPRDSIIWTRKLMDVGIFAGISTGAALSGAIKLASQIDNGHIVIISPDGGWKYLSTGAWIDDLDVVEQRAKTTIYF